MKKNENELTVADLGTAKRTIKSKKTFNEKLAADLQKLANFLMANVVKHLALIALAGLAVDSASTRLENLAPVATDISTGVAVGLVGVLLVIYFAKHDV